MRLGLTICVALAGVLGALPARGQAVDGTGLWWDRVGMFGRLPGSDGPGLWWDQYVPENPAYWNGPYYTAPHWPAYEPQPIYWSGLEYSVANAPPESNTGPHGWYGPYSPGWRGVLMPFEEVYPLPSARPAPGVRVTKPKNRQYFRDETGHWQERDSAIPAAAPDRPSTFTQYVRQSAPGAEGRWESKTAAPPKPDPAESVFAEVRPKVIVPAGVAR